MRTVGARGGRSRSGPTWSGSTASTQAPDARRPRATHVPKHLLEHYPEPALRSSRSFPALASDVARGAYHAEPRWSPVTDPTLRPRVLWSGIGAALRALRAHLTVRGEPVGALFLVWWQTGREFEESGGAARVGVARPRSASAWRTRSWPGRPGLKLHETETLLSVGQTALPASTLDVKMHLTRQFLRHAWRTGLGADSAGMWLLGTTRSGWRRWRATTSRRVGSRRSATMRHVAPGARVLTGRRLAAVVRRAVISDRRTREPHASWRRSRPAARRSARILVPTFAQEQMIGGFSAGWWREGPRALRTRSAGLMLRRWRARRGVALQNARLFQDNQRRGAGLVGAPRAVAARSVTVSFDLAGRDPGHAAPAGAARPGRPAHGGRCCSDGGATTGWNVVLRVRTGAGADEEEPRLAPWQAAHHDRASESGRADPEHGLPRQECRRRGAGGQRDCDGLCRTSSSCR